MKKTLIIFTFLFFSFLVSAQTTFAQDSSAGSYSCEVVNNKCTLAPGTSCGNGYKAGNDCGGFSVAECSSEQPVCIRDTTTSTSDGQLGFPCKSGNVCNTGLTCNNNICIGNTSENGGAGSNVSSTKIECGSDSNPGINTAIGCVPIADQNALIGFFLKWGIGIGGGIAFLLILFAGFQIMTSRGDPNRLKAGQELMTSAIAGLLLLIFSVVILRIIGFDILRITQFQ